MLTQNELTELRERLEHAQHPLFYYDNDADGLCSFVLLRRWLGRGTGVSVKNYELNATYARKTQELKADAVVVLDKPLITRDFFQEINAMQLPLIILDHHAVSYRVTKKEFPLVEVYNPVLSAKKSSEPVTYWAYRLTTRKEDLWLAMMGCIADHFLPDFVDEFIEYYPEYWGAVKQPFDAYYTTEIGRIARALSFGLKDSVRHVTELQQFLVACKGPDEVFAEMQGNASFRKRIFEIRKKYDTLLEEAKRQSSGKMLFFEYAGDVSMSADLANELSYCYPEKMIVVVYKKGVVANLSLRGKKVKKILEKVLKRFPDASGGGHQEAVGARVKSSELENFRRALEEINGRA